MARVYTKRRIIMQSFVTVNDHTGTIYLFVLCDRVVSGIASHVTLAVGFAESLGVSRNSEVYF